MAHVSSAPRATTARPAWHVVGRIGDLIQFACPGCQHTCIWTTPGWKAMVARTVPCGACYQLAQVPGFTPPDTTSRPAPRGIHNPPLRPSERQKSERKPTYPA